MKEGRQMENKKEAMYDTVPRAVPLTSGRHQGVQPPEIQCQDGCDDWWIEIWLLSPAVYLSVYTTLLYTD